MDIPKVGKTASKLISKQFEGNIEQFESAITDVEFPFDFTNIEDIGETIHDNIYTWFNNTSNINSWYALKKEVELMIPVISGNISTGIISGVTGKTIVFTGKVEKYTRTEMQEIIREAGAFPVDSVTRTTDLLVVAEKPGGSKLKKARDYGVPTMPINEFLDALAK